MKLIEKARALALRVCNAFRALATSKYIKKAVTAVKTAAQKAAHFLRLDTPPVRRFFDKLLSINYRHYLLGGLVLLSLYVCLISYQLPLERTFSSLGDVGDSFVYYFSSISAEDQEDLPAASITTVPDVDLTRVLPFSVDDIVRKVELFGDNFFDSYNFRVYTFYSTRFLMLFFILFAAVLLLGYALSVCIKGFIFAPAKKGEEAKPSQALLRFQSVTARPFKAARGFFEELIVFTLDHKAYLYTGLGIWAAALNMATIGLSCVAIYFYFAASFDVFALGTFLVRTVIDVLIMFSGAAWPFWVFLGWLILCLVREHIGYKRLEAMEEHNKEVVKDLPVATMVEGVPGAGKTSWMTGAGLTAAANFRDMALNQMLDNDLRFPAFPWASLREDLKDAVKCGEICNPFMIEGWVQRRHARFVRNKKIENVWGYDYTRYPMNYSNDLKLYSLWEVIEIYCKTCFIYSMNSSLIIANYAVRDDLVYDKSAPFPIFDHDIFKRDPRKAHLESAYSHILDWDFVRLGVRMCKDALEQGALDFGVVLITEIGKERGNQNALKELKRLVDECNQKNDRFEDYLKMIRHPAVVDNVVYIKVICDDQRAMAWAADGRELCDIVNIVEVSDRRIVLPCFTWAEMLYDFFRPRYNDFMVEYEASGKGLTLPVYLYRAFWSFFFSRHDRTVNRFSFKERTLQIGTAKEGDGKQAKLVPFYHMDKKDYSDRFATNCHKGLFTPRFIRARKGFADIPTYSGVMATDKELNAQHSHFITANRRDFNDQNKSAKQNTATKGAV